MRVNRSQPLDGRSWIGHPWCWPLLLILSGLGTGSAAVGAVRWLVTLPPMVNCTDPTQITTDRIALSCAQAAAADGNLEAVLSGLNLLDDWGSNHGLFHETQPLVDQWSMVVVEAADRELLAGRRDEAVALLDHIPPTSPWYTTGQERLAHWNQEWAQGSDVVAQAQAAIANQDWRTAAAQVLVLEKLSYPQWRVVQAQAIARQIEREQRAQAQVRQAVALASQGPVDRLIDAVDLISHVDPNTLTHDTAQGYLDRWSDALLAEGIHHWETANFDRAIQLGRAVSRNPHRAQVAQDLIWLSQGRQLAQQSLTPRWITPNQMLGLYRAMLLVNRIPRRSPYYARAQSSVTTWRDHLEGMETLQLAQLAGGISRVSTLKLAIRQAQTIPPGHPQRLQAQTLVAHWQQTLERTEDAPYLAQAHQWAKTYTPAGLQRAIASASRITAQRALRGEAQSWIYVWRHQLQTLEDRPILDRAYQLAHQGQWSQAVVTASAVQSGRALYDEAQTAIGQWRRAIADHDQAHGPNPIATSPSSVAVSSPPRSSQSPVPRRHPPLARPREEIESASASVAVPGSPVATPEVWSTELPDHIETVPGPDPPESGTDPPPLMPPIPRPSVVLGPMASPSAPVRLTPAHSASPWSHSDSPAQGASPSGSAWIDPDRR